MYNAVLYVCFRVATVNHSPYDNIARMAAAAGGGHPAHATATSTRRLSVPGRRHLLVLFVSNGPGGDRLSVEGIVVSCELS